MPKISIIHMAIGFSVVFFVAAAGAFLSLDITDSYVYETGQIDTWQHLLLRSAHGHTNLFGMLHILFGLTLPYSNFSQKVKNFQGCGLGMGTLAMSLGLFIQAQLGPSQGYSVIGVVLGILLSAALVAIGSHSVALFSKAFRT